MATISHIPNPISVSVKTAGYTIPANRYARAVVSLEGSATFTLDAVTALRGTQNTVLGSSILDTQTVFLVGGATAGQTLYSGSGPTSVPASAGSAFTSSTDQKTVVHDFFLSAGTIINGTGTWRAVVEEYGG